jgi:hypothetical protein
MHLNPDFLPKNHQNDDHALCLRPAAAGQHTGP